MVRINEDLWLWSGCIVSGVTGSVTVVYMYVPAKGVPLIFSLVLFFGGWLSRWSAKASVGMREGVSFVVFLCWYNCIAGGPKTGPFLINNFPTCMTEYMRRGTWRWKIFF